MLRTGVDIVEVERIKAVAERQGDAFYRRFFTGQERAHCEGNYPSLAARFAAKEAVGKVFGTGIGDVSWVEIEIVNDQRGKPELVLHGNAAQMAEDMGLTEWSVSMSHTKEHAVAMVVAMGARDESA